MFIFIVMKKKQQSDHDQRLRKISFQVPRAKHLKSDLQGNRKIEMCMKHVPILQSRNWKYIKDFQERKSPFLKHFFTILRTVK